MKIMPNRMDRGFFKYQNEFENKALEVLRSGWYVLGKKFLYLKKNLQNTLEQNIVLDLQVDWMHYGLHLNFCKLELVMRLSFRGILILHR